MLEGYFQALDHTWNLDAREVKFVIRVLPGSHKGSRFTSCLLS